MDAPTLTIPNQERLGNLVHLLKTTDYRSGNRREPSFFGHRPPAYSDPARSSNHPYLKYVQFPSPCIVLTIGQFGVESNFQGRRNRPDPSQLGLPYEFPSELGSFQNKSLCADLHSPQATAGHQNSAHQSCPSHKMRHRAHRRPRKVHAF